LRQRKLTRRALLVTEREQILAALAIAANVVNDPACGVDVALILRQCDNLLDRLNALDGLSPPLPPVKACRWLGRQRRD
jgi:hypothetical protein